MTLPSLNSIRNAWVFITQNGITFMIREDRECCWLTEQASGDARPYPSPQRALKALSGRRTGVRAWDNLPSDVPDQLAEWTQILPTSVFNRQVQDLVDLYGVRAKA